MVKRLLAEAGWPENFNCWGWEVTKEQRESFWKAEKEAVAKATTPPVGFDAVLTDLMVPASKQAMGGAGVRLAGQEMGLGTTIAFLALSKGVKLVAVITDMSHHAHPASAAFDCFSWQAFSIGDARVLLDHGNVITRVDAKTMEELSDTFLNSEEGKKKYPVNTKTCGRDGVVLAKAWHQTLEKLLAGPK